MSNLYLSNICSSGLSFPEQNYNLHLNSSISSLFLEGSVGNDREKEKGKKFPFFSHLNSTGVDLILTCSSVF